MIAGQTVVGEYQGNREISQESNSKLAKMIKKKRSGLCVFLNFLFLLLLKIVKEVVYSQED